ncbi:perforin-1-like, partial [Bombina bombina]|uniref:perforin-1-like n=1 Tax=Bombina bombina TaxID=8345 RepID=UPI00235AAC08
HIAQGSQCETLHFVPGHTLVGEGLNIVTMKPTRAFLINMQNYYRADNTCTVCNNPHRNNQLQKLPCALVDWKPINYCARKISSKVFHSTVSAAEESSSRVQNDWKIGLNLDFGPLNAKNVLAGSHSTLTEFIESKTSTDRYTFTSYKLSCTYYSFRLGHIIQLTSHFKKALDMLPTSYNNRTKHKYRHLIQTYGTHYISQAEVGGEALDVTALRTCQIAMDGISVDELKDCLDIEINADLTGKVEAGAKANSCKHLTQNMTKGESFHQTFNERSWQIMGGNMNFDLLSFDAKKGESACLFNKWLTSLKEIPALLTYSLEPLHTLMKSERPQKENLRKAITEYIIENALQKDCLCPSDSQPSAGAECSCVCHASHQRGQNCCPTKRGLAKLMLTIKHGNDIWGDYMSKTDAYVKVRFGDNMIRTSTIWDNNNPIWNFSVDMGIVDLASIHELMVEVWDEDKIDSDGLLGTCKKPLVIGEASGICYLNHGSVTYAQNVICIPHLSGPKCQNYSPSKEK